VSPHLDAPDEGHGDSLFKLVQRSVEVQDLHDLQHRGQQRSIPSHAADWLFVRGSADLLRAEGGAQRADGLGVLARLLLDLQQLSGLDDGVQGGCSFTLEQVVPPQPLLHLTGVVSTHTQEARCT